VDGDIDGETGSSGILIDGREGLWVFWYENGQKEMEHSFRDGALEGLATHWHENGQKGGEATFRDGKQEGLSTSWFEDGQKRSETTYRDGTRTSGTEWDESGNQTRAD
jgi:antitoxin component YwqK of YwqJK toxin-antitoxin module